MKAADLSSTAYAKAMKSLREMRLNWPTPWLCIVHPEVYKLVEAGYSVEDAVCKYYLGVEPNEKSESRPSDSEQQPDEKS